MAIFLLGGLCAVVASSVGAGYWLFHRSPPEPDFPPPPDQATANRQDLEYLRLVMSYSRSFSPQERVAFEQSVDRLVARAADLDRAALEMGIARAVAVADDGHTNVRGVSRGHYLNALPVRLGTFAEGIFVVRASPEQSDLLGAQLLAEGGRAPEELARALRPYVGGAPSLARELLPNFLQSPQALHAAGLLSSPAQATMTFRLRDGTRVERTLTARSVEQRERDRWPMRSLSPVPESDDTSEWPHVLDGLQSPPFFLRNPNAMYWHAFREDLDLIYIQLNGIRDEPGGSLESYLKTLLDEIERSGSRYAVLDLRFAPGGNYELTVDFTRRLPQLIPADGSIFILTSGNTFSAALITAARLKYFAGARGHIVGEPMGDYAQFWAEGKRISLPNSRIIVSYATGYHDWEHGCRNLVKCYWANSLYGVPAGTLSPDWPAPLKFSDYVAGRDTAFERIAAGIGS